MAIKRMFAFAVQTRWSPKNRYQTFCFALVLFILSTLTIRIVFFSNHEYVITINIINKNIRIQGHNFIHDSTNGKSKPL